MKFCPKCKKEYKEDIKFCPTDGTALHDFSTANKTSGMSGGKIYSKGDVKITNTTNQTINQIVDDESLKKPINVWVKIRDKIWDPVSLDTLRSWVQNGTAETDDSVSYDGKNWKKIKSLSEMNESPDELGIKLVEMQKLEEISELAKVVEQQRRDNLALALKAEREKKKEDKETEKVIIGCGIIAAVVLLFLAVAWLWGEISDYFYAREKEQSNIEVFQEFKKKWESEWPKNEVRIATVGSLSGWIKIIDESASRFTVELNDKDGIYDPRETAERINEHTFENLPPGWSQKFEFRGGFEVRFSVSNYGQEAQGSLKLSINGGPWVSVPLINHQSSIRRSSFRFGTPKWNKYIKKTSSSSFGQI